MSDHDETELREYDKFDGTQPLKVRHEPLRNLADEDLRLVVGGIPTQKVTNTSGAC